MLYWKGEEIEVIRTQKRFRIYIDESGDHTYSKIKKISDRYLGLTGVIIESEYYRMEFSPDLEELKQKHFPHNPDSPVVLHRNDIINKRGPFWRLKDKNKQENFNNDLLDFLDKQQYHLISVVLDKYLHQKNYGISAFHPYHYCLTALLERYCGYLNYFNAVGDVMAESRGREEDKQLKIEYQHLYLSGTYYRDASFFQKTLTSKEIKLKKKRANIAGLQLADLLAYPSKQDMLINHGVISRPQNRFGNFINNCIQPKYNKRFDLGTIDGYGKVYLNF